MSSSYRLRKRQETNAFEFGSDWSSHYIRPFNNCYVGDMAVPIGRPDGVKVCVRNRQESTPDSLVESSTKGNTVNGLYKSYNLYYPQREFQNRPFNPHPDAFMDQEDLINKDYLKLPIRYNGTGLENMGQESGQEFAYAWQAMDGPRPSIPIQKLPWSIPSDSDPQWRANYDLTHLHSSPKRGDLRNELYDKYPHPPRNDYWHTTPVRANYPEYAPQPRFLPGGTVNWV